MPAGPVSCLHCSEKKETRKEVLKNIYPNQSITGKQSIINPRPVIK